MARLPSKFDLSQPTSMVSKRVIASADQSAIGRGISQFGAGLAALGQNIEQEREKTKQQNNAVDIARAEALKTEQLLGVQNEFDNDPDYSTYNKRAPAKTGEVVKKAADLIRDPEMRERWQAGAQSDAARVNDSIFDRGTTIRRQAETNALDEALEVNRRIYVDPESSDEAKAKARADIEGTIQAGQGTGLLTPDQAAARKQTYIDNADFSRGELEVARNPDAVARPLPETTQGRVTEAMSFFTSQGWSKEQAAGIVGNLVGESNLNTGARNPGDGKDGSDSIGIGQWNGSRARALKAYAGERGLDWKDFGVQLAFVNQELNGSESAAGNALRSAKNIDEATAAFVGYERPAGWSPNNPRGAHNYKGRLKFAAQAAGQEVNPDWYRRLSPEDRSKIDKQAEVARNVRNVETRGHIEVVAANAPIAIQNTGGYDGQLPSIDQFFDAYGPQDGAQRYNAFQASIDTSQQAFEMRTMPAEQIEALVAAAKPVSSGDNAALETERYNVLSSAAAATLKARDADPAAFARQTFPSVEEAWANVDQEGGYQNALAVTAAAQAQLGIEKMRLVPSDMAESAVEKFKDVNLSERERLESSVQLLFATNDEGQRKAIFDQLVDAGLPDISEGAFYALERGEEGAARRLFHAAMIDPTKLPGTLEIKPAAIDAAIQAQLMDEGAIGDVYYGLSDGSLSNMVKAERDSKLLTNAVNLRLRDGETLKAAVDGAAKDLFGDVVVVEGNGSVNAQILLPRDQDDAPVLDGLASLLPTVREALAGAMTIPGDAPAADGTRAVLDAATSSYVENVMAQGYFRNSGDDFVFIDPFRGAAVFGESGGPIKFTMQDVLNAAPQRDPGDGDFSRRMIEENAARRSVFE